MYESSVILAMTADSAIDVARYLIRLCTPTETEDVDHLGNMRLQKLLYYVQAWHLATTGARLFANQIQAWRDGPVVPDAYYSFKDHGVVIRASAGADPDTLVDSQKAFIRAVWNKYKMYSTFALRDMTHREKPWIDAWGDLPPNAIGSTEITPEAMRTYFLDKLIKRLKDKDPRIDENKWRASADAIAAGQTQSIKDIRRELQDRRRASANPPGN